MIKLPPETDIWYDLNENILYLFTDGSSRKVFNKKYNKKTGRHWWEWARIAYIWTDYFIYWEDITEYISYDQATNQEMELKAVIDGLEYIINNNHFQKDFRKLIVVTDSEYVHKNWKFTRWKRQSRGWKTINNNYIMNKKLRKKFEKVYWKIIKVFNSFDVDWVKWHSDTYFNNKADKSAVQSAISQNRVKQEPWRWVRANFLESAGFDWDLDIKWEKWLLIHVTSYKWAQKWWKRYNCEIVSCEHQYFCKRTRIYTNLSVSSAYIYKVNIADDNSHQIEKIIEKFSKQEIKEDILKHWFNEKVFK